MATRKIKLGDEIEDVTSKTSGVAIGRVEYLSGAVYWIIQPPTTDDNLILKEVYIPEGYCKRLGPGVYPEPRQPMGFHVDENKA